MYFQVTSFTTYDGQVLRMKEKTSIPTLILLFSIFSCFLLWFGGIGDFLILVTITHWLAGIPVLGSKRFFSDNTKGGLMITYGKGVKMGWVVIGVFWSLLTLYALKGANVSLLQLITITLRHMSK